jgi:hypothetical protein
MVSELFFYQLALSALLWLCCRLHGIGPRDHSTVPTPRPQPTPPRRTRHREPKPFAGLTRTPPCDAWAHATALRPPPPSSPPPRLTPTRGRRRQGDTSPHCCPTPAWASRGGVGWGTRRAHGHPQGGPWRQLLCVVCRGYLLEPRGPRFHGKRGAVELIVRVIACVAAGLGIRGTARGCEVAAHTVLHGLVEAAEQLRACTQHARHDVRVRQGPMDDLFALLSAVKAGDVSPADAIARLDPAPQWVGVALDPESTLLLALAVGHRTLAMAQRVVHQVVQGLAPDGAPLFLTDGFRESLTALLTPYGQGVHPPRRQDKGPAPQPRWRPRPGLLSAPGVKTVRHQRLVDVQHRVGFGALEAVKHLRAPRGWQINTACVERLNLSLRQQVAAVRRRVSTRCKGEDGVRQQVALCHVYSNCCLPHASVRLPLPPPVPTHGMGSATQWRPCTPAMAAGLPDRLWTLREVLRFRVPPWSQPAEG